MHLKFPFELGIRNGKEGTQFFEKKQQNYRNKSQQNTTLFLVLFAGF